MDLKIFHFGPPSSEARFGSFRYQLNAHASPTQMASDAGSARAPSQIVEFYAGQTLFLTGVTGFLGKIVLAQLLQHCPKIKKVFCLIRGRQGVSAAARFEKEVFSIELFTNLIKKDPSIRDKMHIVEGDISLNKLGLSPEATAVVEAETTVIIHCAATTKFDETLKVAIQLNTMGAKRVLDLAKNCKHLLSHVHVSTAYVNCIHNSGNIEIREKIYPLAVNPYDFLEKVSTMTQEQAHAQTEQLIAPYPNTYTFTKAIGEHILLAEKGDVPLAIVRPSIVGCAYQYPLPGWVDSMIAASGLLLMLGVGALHSMHGNSSNISDIIPVDTISTILLSAAWRTAVQYGTLNPGMTARKPSLPIYHGTTSTKNPTMWSTSLRIVEGYFRRHPAKRAVGLPWAIYVPGRIQHRLFHHAVHTVPAAVSDALTYAKGGKPTLVKKSGRLLKAVKTLAYFTSYQWFYSTENVDALIDVMNEEDLRLFPVDVRKIDWEVYFLTYAQGLRRYMLKEVDELDVDNPNIRAKL